MGHRSGCRWSIGGEDLAGLVGPAAAAGLASESVAVVGLVSVVGSTQRVAVGERQFSAVSVGVTVVDLDRELVRAAGHGAASVSDEQCCSQFGGYRSAEVFDAFDVGAVLHDCLEEGVVSEPFRVSNGPGAVGADSPGFWSRRVPSTVRPVMRLKTASAP